jgi:hypothetical protein
VPGTQGAQDTAPAAPAGAGADTLPAGHRLHMVTLPRLKEPVGQGKGVVEVDGQ